MHQYFIDEPIHVGDSICLSPKQEHHAKNVLKLEEETIRLVSEGIGYFATIHSSKKAFYAEVYEEDPRVNELPVSVTLAMALIRKEKMELVLQKATELGVNRIVPFVSSRCVVKSKEEKKDRVLERYQAIVKEAAEQCKRNRIPEVCETMDFKNLKDYQSAYNYAAYENAYGNASYLKDVETSKSVTVVIGPEGGFSKEEVEFLVQSGFTPITFGNRILRAETAAMYALSVLGEKNS